jgi:hypothetical protein
MLPPSGPEGIDEKARAAAGGCLLGLGIMGAIFIVLGLYAVFKHFLG